MSYTHTHFFSTLLGVVISISNPDVLRYYAKYDGLVGSSESMEYLDKKLKEYYDSKGNK